jgi:hypothetical protein
MNSVVICYSLTGTTRKLAERVAARIGASVTALNAPKVRGGPLALLRLGFLALYGRSTPVNLDHPLPPTADLAILAAPVWAGKVAFPMRVWLNSDPVLPAHRALIMTGGAPTESREAMADFTRRAGGRVTATLYADARSVLADRTQPQVDAFCAAILGHSPLDR